MDLSILQILIAWAVTLSDYPAPAALPEFQLEPHAFFVEHACGGRECKVVGWYDDNGVVYLDERYASLESEFASSLVVHELVHYLQDLSGRFDSHSCADSLQREREAYRVQNEFMLQAQGSLRFASIMHVSCGYPEPTLTTHEPPAE